MEAMVEAAAYGAELSPCRRYRYRLWRTWGSGQLMAWIMLNPSTADSEVDDPTIRRCMSFARREGFDGIEVLNLYAYRVTDPKQLAEVYQVEGPDNAHHWGDVLTDARVGLVVAAWGAYRPKVEGEILRSRALETLGDTPTWCLGTTKSGAPRHPLYVKADRPFEPWG
jgi:hypothetical protein